MLYTKFYMQIYQSRYPFIIIYIFIIFNMLNNLLHSLNWIQRYWMFRNGFLSRI